MGDSKDLWLSIHKDFPRRNITLGFMSSNAYVSDPKMIAFMASRYKFVSKLLAGRRTALEVGCGDAFAAPLVAQTVGHLLCTDIDEPTIRDNTARVTAFPNIDFRFHDFRQGPLAEPVEAAYSCDVLEHVFPAEEAAFVGNIAASLVPQGVFVVGSPNIHAKDYASEYSRRGHVNLKSQDTLHALMSRYFENVFMFSMNDEVVHTGFAPMANYNFALCVTPRRDVPAAA